MLVRMFSRCRVIKSFTQPLYRSYYAQKGQGRPIPNPPPAPSVATPPANDPYNIYWHFHRLGKQGRGTLMTPERREKKYLDFVTKENNNVQDISLSNLKPMPFSRKKKVRVGRGRGSGRGRTSGRGHNGQKQRNGVNIPVLFEGGQTPIFKRIPKLKWTNRRNKLRYQEVNLERLQYFIDTGRIDPSTGAITMLTLKQSGLVRTLKWPGVKLLARGFDNFTAKVDIEIPRASKSAIAAIEKAGGSIRCIYYNRRSVVQMLHRKYQGIDYRKAMGMPPPKLFQYYMRSDIRGYLALAGYDRQGINEHEKVPDHEQEAERKRAEKLLQDYLLKKKKQQKV